MRRGVGFDDEGLGEGEEFGEVGAPVDTLEALERVLRCDGELKVGELAVVGGYLTVDEGLLVAEAAHFFAFLLGSLFDDADHDAAQCLEVDIGHLGLDLVDDGFGKAAEVAIGD